MFTYISPPVRIANCPTVNGPTSAFGTVVRFSKLVPVAKTEKPRPV